MSNSPDQLDVIAVGAHPDDVEIGCGGTLARLAEQGYRIGIVDLTDGEPTPLSPGPESRLAEAQRAAEILGVTQRIILDLPNRRLFDSFEARVALAKVFRTYRPRLVLGLGDRTPLASPDHWQTRQITDAGVFYSRLTKWDEHFGGLPVHTVKSQLYYFLNHQSLELPAIGNSFVYDIGGNLPRKIAAVRAFESQFPPAKDHLFRRLEAQAHFFGESAGFAAGELLASPRTLGSRDLLAEFAP
jgi:N-acetylglucosamine malate deacetylase 1